MKYIILIALFMTGCASLPPDAVHQEVANRVKAFNELRHANIPIPVVVYSDMGDTDGLTTHGGIIINPTACAQDMNDCLNDTIPHELAHWAVYYYSGEHHHDGIWCDTMRAFGGVPEKHGYCLTKANRTH